MLEVAPRGGEEPGRVAMGRPVLTEQGRRARRRGHVAVLGPLAVMHVHEHPRAVDVADLEVEALLEPQAQRGGGPEVGPVVGCADGVDEPPHLVDGQDIGERLGPGDAELPERLPVARRGAGVEGLDPAGGDDQRTGGELLVILDVTDRTPSARRT